MREPAVDRSTDIRDLESIQHDMNYTIPVLKDILAVNPSLLILSTPWTPPIWMKNSSNYGDGTLLPDMVFTRVLWLENQSY